jgi:ferredoxin-NADP reductase
MTPWEGCFMHELVSAQLVARLQMSQDTCSFTFAAMDASFPSCDAGSHIDVHLPGGLVRNYSLTDWEPDRVRVSVAVKLEPAGRGGSAAMHDLEIGSIVQIGPPRNNFPLRTDGQPIVLLAGGIGITPLYAMARVLRVRRRQFDLHYLVRTRTAAAFDAPLQDLDLDGAYHLHCDDANGLPDFAGLLVCYPRIEPELSGSERNCLRANHLMAQQETGSNRNCPDRWVANPLVAGSSPARPIRYLYDVG